MSEWIGLTDDDLPFPKVATGALAACWGAGVAELSGYRNEDDKYKQWTVAAFDVDGVAIAVHVDWEVQSIVVARHLGEQ